jgi:hypothetical protein
MTPARLQSLLDEAGRLQAETQLGILAAVNRGFAGGDGYAELQKILQRATDQR